MIYALIQINKLARTEQVVHLPPVFKEGEEKQHIDHWEKAFNKDAPEHITYKITKAA